MSNLVLTVRESVRYRGRGGHWSWIAHRLSGLGIIAFLVIHIWETAMANYNPKIYEWAIAVFKHPLLGVGEIVLMGAVLYHAFNGIRITILDFQPNLWKHQNQTVVIVWVIFLVIFIPIGIYMLVGIFNHCSLEAATSCWTLPPYPSF